MKSQVLHYRDGSQKTECFAFITQLQEPSPGRSATVLFFRSSSAAPTTEAVPQVLNLGDFTSEDDAVAAADHWVRINISDRCTRTNLADSASGSP